MPNPVIPVPVTWAAGRIRATQLRADVSDAVALLSRPPMLAASQTQTSQSIPGSAGTAITLDTEAWDSWSGHQISSNPSRYYSQLPGWYLCESSVPLNYTGGAGTLSAMIGGTQNGGADTQYGGGRVRNSSGGPTECAVAAKLMLLQQTGPVGGSGDYAYPATFQSSGGAASLLNGAAEFPTFTARWVCAVSGTQPLPVAPLTSVPNPITSAWLNANVRDAIRFLIYPPIMEWAFTTTGLAIASSAAIPSAGAAIAIATKIIDNYSAFNSGLGTWTAPVAGVYYAYGLLSLVTATTTVALGAGITVTSSNYNGGSPITLWGGTIAASGAATIMAAVVRKRIRLNAGDTAWLAGVQNDSGSNAAAVNGSGAWATRLILVWAGA